MRGTAEKTYVRMRDEGTRARTSCVRAASDLRKRLDRSSTRRASPRRSAAPRYRVSRDPRDRVATHA